MSTPVDDLFKQASILDEKDRATLAGLLLESLELKLDEDVEIAWRDEVERRLTELDDGGVELITWEAVQAKLRKSTGAEPTN